MLVLVLVLVPGVVLHRASASTSFSASAIILALGPVELRRPSRATRPAALQYVNSRHAEFNAKRVRGQSVLESPRTRNRDKHFVASEVLTVGCFP